ncbi:MAG: hypothetical protein RR977_00680, partial [Oscillospiraceae bacterium]
MELRKKIKKNALQSLRNSWGKVIAILFFLCLVNALFALFQELFCDWMGIDWLNGKGGQLDLFRGTLEIGFPFFLMTVLFLVIHFIVIVPLYYGATKWYLCLAAGDSPPIITMFDCFLSFREFFRALFLKISLVVRILGVGILLMVPSGMILWGIHFTNEFSSSSAVLMKLVLIPLFVVITITALVFLFVFSLRYFLARYLFISGGRSISQCIRLSVQVMKGN